MLQLAFCLVCVLTSASWSTSLVPILLLLCCCGRRRCMCVDACLYARVRTLMYGYSGTRMPVSARASMRCTPTCLAGCVHMRLHMRKCIKQVRAHASVHESVHESVRAYASAWVCARLFALVDEFAHAYGCACVPCFFP